MSSNTDSAYGLSVHDIADTETDQHLLLQMFQDLLTTVSEICFVVPPGGEHISYCNSIAADILGYAHNELLCMSVKAIVEPQSLSGLCTMLHEAEATQLGVHGQNACKPYRIQLIHKDRTNISGTIHCFFKTAAEGEVAAVYGVIRLDEPGLSAVESSETAVQTEEVTVPTATTPAALTTDPNLPGKILIMDDEDILIDIAVQMGRRLGLIVETSTNGEEAIEIYQKAFTVGKQHDAVLLDMTISGGAGGLETAKKLHSIDPAVKTIVMSGYVDHEVMSQPNKYGFTGVISKPFRLVEFSRILHEVIPEGKFRDK